jgi:amino acid adenylation domain-containing protein
VALGESGRTTSYGELNARANRVAHAVLRRRGRGEEAVAVLLGKDARLVAAFLGIVKAGKIYVPLDPAHPAERSRIVLEDSGAGCILTDAGHAELAATLARSRRCEVVDVDRDAGDGVEAGVDPGLPLTADTLATIIYTSGSTGRPKGVLKDHRATLHNARKAAVSLAITEADRVLMVQSGSVMGGVRDMLLALLCRAVLVPFDLAVLGVGALAEAVRRERPTIVNTVVTVFRHWVATLRPEDRFPTVRVLKTGSEPMAPADLAAFRRHFGHGARLWAGFGSTETGNVTQVLIDRDAPLPDGNRVPVGRCFDGLEVLVVDEALRPVPAGETGEVLVRTRYMARGYWRRPEVNARVFLPDPDGGDRRIYRTGDFGRQAPDGSVELMGRLDSMVKVRGQRVELGEIELALLALPHRGRCRNRLNERDGALNFFVGHSVAQDHVDLVGDLVLELFGRDTRPGGHVGDEQVASLREVEGERLRLGGDLPLTDEIAVQPTALTHAEHGTAHARRVVLG